MSVAEAWDTPRAAANEPADYHSLEGARELADKVNAFWAARGIKANARPVLMPFSAAMRSNYYVVRSDLVVGTRVRAEPKPEVEA